MRIVEVTLPVAGGAAPAALRFDPTLAELDVDRITAEQFREALERLLDGHLDARWVISVENRDGSTRQGTVGRAIAERIGSAYVARTAVHRLCAAPPAGTDPLRMLALRAGLELQGRLAPRATPALVAAALHTAERRERQRIEDRQQSIDAADYRRNQRAAELEGARSRPPEARAEALRTLDAATAELEALRTSPNTPDPATLAAAFVLSLHQARDGRPGALRPEDHPRLQRTLAVLADRRDALDALADAELGPVADRLTSLLAAAALPHPELGPLPLVLDRPLAGVDPDLARHALRGAAAQAGRTQLIVLGSAAPFRDWAAPATVG